MKKHEMTDDEKEAYKKLEEKFELVPKRDKKHIKKVASESNVFAHTINIVRQPQYMKTFAFGAVLFGVLYTFLYGLWRIPVVDFGINRMTEVGVLDYTYLFLISTLTGVMFSLYRFGKAKNIKSSSRMAGGGGFISAIFAGVCPVCQGIQILALGSTIVSIPLAFIVPYIGLIQIMTILIMGFALYLKANSIFTQTCVTCRVDTKIEHKETGKAPFLYENNMAFATLMILTLVLAINSFMLPAAFASVSSGNGGSISLKPGFEYGSKVTLKPMPLASGESPRIQGYKTTVKTLPTISELALAGATGDVVQDLVNNVVPHGTPWYGSEAGVSFDDPIVAQKLWANGRAIQLSSDEQARWERTVNSFTCDYCCGSPQNPTIITRCGCAHSAAAQGMAKWFIKNYGSKYSDEEIYGEMARWYAVWYPGPTVNRIIQELQV